MPADEVAEIVTAVADALDYAHQRNLLHRDVKPANILLANPQSEGQRILLADFGIARWADDPSGLTATNMTVGTVSYAAPEQLMGGHLDGRADQYALAATAFHLLTGSPPFQHTNPAVVISQHLSASPPAIGDRRPDLSALDPVLAKALAKNPNDRFERCSDFARALGHRLGDVPPDATRLSPAAADPPKAGRSPLRPAVVVPAVLAILLVAAIGFALLELNRADDERAAPLPRTTAATSVRDCPSAPDAVAPTPRAAAIDARDDDRDHGRDHDVDGRGRARRGDRRRLLAARQHGHDRQRLDGLLLDAAEHRRNDLVVEPGRGAEPDGDHGTDRRALAHRGGVAGPGVHAADRPDPQAVP